MNKTLTYGLAATSIVLGLSLAYVIGSNSTQDVYANQGMMGRFANTNVTYQSDLDFDDMRNHMNLIDTSNMGYRTNGNTTMMNGYDSNNQSCDESLFTDSANLDLTLTDISESELEKMLTVLINDEYKARAEYVALVDEFGNVNPFYQLINAETKHIDALTNLFDAYGIDVPADNGADYAVIPSSLEEAYAVGAQAEIDNMALYEGYLTQDLPVAVETVFENLMNASAHHLDAFEAALDGNTSYSSNQMMGRGQRGRY